ncbi:MAG: alpha/beta hydrolase [Sinimarinibacterium sp.]|jgi:acetyl esterase/lipase
MKLRLFALAVFSAALAACSSTTERSSADASGLLTWRDVRGLPAATPVPQLQYGPEPRQFGELRLPPGVPGPFPVLILIPGDCETSDDDGYLRPLAESLATLGVATWMIDYRRAADDADWRDSFRDVALATDHLSSLAQEYPLNLKRVVAAGHAGGGELALWLAARKRLREGDPLYVRKPQAIHGVIGLAAITDLEAQRVVPQSACAQAVEALTGGAVAEPGRVAALSPIALLPLGVPQWFVHGAEDAQVPAGQVMHYAETARRKGDRVTLGVTSNAGHYEPVVPASATWMTLQQAVIAALHDPK